MPPATTKCSICGQTVMKSQTYATGQKDAQGLPLRACKCHEGVINKANELKKNEHTCKHKIEPDFNMETQLEEIKETALWAENHCWVCERQGISKKELFRLQLIVLEKLRLMGKPVDFFNPQQIAQHIHIPKEYVIFDQFYLNGEQFKLFEKWENRFNFKVRKVIKMFGLCQICEECQEITGIKFEMKLPDFSNPEVLQTFLSIGSVYENSEFREDNIKIASEVLIEERLIKEAIQNN